MEADTVLAMEDKHAEIRFIGSLPRIANSLEMFQSSCVVDHDFSSPCFLFLSLVQFL